MATGPNNPIDKGIPYELVIFGVDDIQVATVNISSRYFPK